MCVLQQSLHVPPFQLIQAHDTLFGKAPYSYMYMASMAKHGKCEASRHISMQCNAWNHARKQTLPCHLTSHVQHVYKVTCRLAQERRKQHTSPYLCGYNPSVLGVGAPPPEVTQPKYSTSYGQSKPSTVRHLVQIGCIPKHADDILLTAL